LTRRTLLVVVLLLAVTSLALATTLYRVDRARCTGCGDCEQVCPVSAIEILDGKSHIDPELCIGCGFCMGVCSYEAIR